LGYVRKESLTAITRLWYPRYKNLHHTVEKRNENYNRRIEQIEELEREGKVFVFRPSKDIAISRLEKDPAQLEQVYELGLKDAAAQWQALEEYLVK
jgi:predicted patatin/cPLA2 family phospholipase